ncbi:hypothetical protein GIS00_15565 [Nakamurella sp. YIM 132087]|uniref:HTH luxR-type domain-containing protein n=1 Tax=Nakamurella alba TaxID=2665158 RepID=A0A7K1FML1_9ACTN|nr:helix-turn-helix domain-containing protein [Nakamurella alba]MTD15358.1 hypothetical protein [Nakamurella alba]
MQTDVHDQETDCATVYRFALRTGSIPCLETLATTLAITLPDLRAAVELLVERRLLRRDGVSFIPVDPEIAAAILVSPMEREIQQNREHIARIRARTDVFRQDYVDSVQPLAGDDMAAQRMGGSELCGYLLAAAQNCRSEVLVLLSGGHEREAFGDFLQLCRYLAERAVPIRVVCQHRGRADLAVRTRLKALTDLGAEIRTVTYVPRSAVVLDRRSALLFGGDATEITANRIGRVDVVGFLLDMFDHMWDLATPMASHRSGYDEVSDDLQRTLSSMMAKGFTDEVLARKLGLSVRTCRRHIATLMRDLGAVSRFQAGVLASRREMVDD